MTLSISSVRTQTRKDRTASGVFPFRTALSIWAERRALAKMDATRLADMGISPVEAAAEAARPFWDLPDRTCR